MNKYFFTVLLILIPALLFSQSYRKKYHGAIGPYPITITLVVKNGNLTGTYYYESFDDPISIRGFVTGKSIRFRGFDLKGNMIDEFVGQINKHDIQGIWIGEGMQKRFPFKLIEDFVPAPAEEPVVTLPKLSGIIIGLFAAIALFIYFRLKKTKAIPRWLRILHLKYKSLFAPDRIHYEFEKFVADHLDPNTYKLIEWHNKKSKKFTLSSHAPDLVFERRNARDVRFAIECRYSNRFNNKVRIENHNDGGKNPMFVALGFGGVPSNPEAVYMVPVDKVNDKEIRLNEISRFRVSGETLNFDPDNKTLL
jgi:hypothetical protein